MNKEQLKKALEKSDMSLNQITKWIMSMSEKEKDIVRELLTNKQKYEKTKMG